MKARTLLLLVAVCYIVNALETSPKAEKASHSGNARQAFETFSRPLTEAEKAEARATADMIDKINQYTELFPEIPETRSDDLPYHHSKMHTLPEPSQMY